MKGNINITSQEKDHIKEIIREDYLKKFPDGNFEKDYSIYLELPEFEAMGCIYNLDGSLKEDFKDFSKSVHYIMRLVGAYHVNQALKALKFDTTNDGNMYSRDENGNIGTFGRIVKAWGGDKLDNSTFSEFGDGRFTPVPRMAGFPVKRKTIKVQNIKSLSCEEYVIQDEQEREYDVKLGQKGGNKCYIFIDQITSSEFYLEYSEDLKFEIGKSYDIIEDTEIVVKSLDTVGMGSLCSHHFLPYYISKGVNSRILVAYKPYNTLVGLSKLGRICQYAGNKPSLQEGITDQIFEVLKEATGTEDVFVSLQNFVHTCECTRGGRNDSGTTTEKAGGVFKDELLRQNIINS